ncbi:glycerophosphodiester phosphodiesterase family protein [Pseudoxanthobacter sp.]|uniref:glycerophosphodiester phosphodiesterase family protein n=1 Tax=Pseudoxanthobacter sp. TaxID=1925742 RepID=UPI002FE31154
MARRRNTPDWLTATPIAHRGLHDAARGIVENTLPAAEAAIAHGFAIECDVQLSADGAVVVFHDDTLERLTGAAGPVARRDLAALRLLSLKGTDARIPTLQELLELVDDRVPLLIELKSTWRRDGGKALVAAVAGVMAACRGRAALMSFDPDIVELLHLALPDRPVGITADRALRGPDYAGQSAITRFGLRHLLHGPRTRPDFVAYDVAALPMPATLVMMRLLHRPVLTWTVRTEKDLFRARAFADQIIFEGFVPENPQR